MKSKQSKIGAFSPQEIDRMLAFIRKHGHTVARERIGIALITFDIAKSGGTLRSHTRQKILDSLAREEAIDIANESVQRTG